jgi:Peptidase family M23
VEGDIVLELRPSPVYVERGAAGQLLNFDLEFANHSVSAYRLDSITLTAFDRSGRVVLRRTVDEHGLRPAIETIPHRVVPAGGSLLVFNPLHTFAPSLDLHELRCTCLLGGEERESVRVEAEVGPVAYEQDTDLFLPLSGRVLIAEGHDFVSPHRRIDPMHPFAAQLGLRVNSGRYADDYSLVNEAGELFAAEGRHLDDWLGFGAVVRAPGAGTVVTAAGHVPDNELASDGVQSLPQLDDPAAAIFGNHVVLDHGTGEFSVLAHLQHRSVEVRAGDSVDARQPIARLGLSGNTDFVHLHYQVQNGPDALVAEGLPFTFANVRGPLEAGTIVES